MGQEPPVNISSPHLSSKVSTSIFIYLFDISVWMSHRHLGPTISKNELLIFLSKLFSIWIKSAIFHPFAKARNLGVIFDSCLSFVIYIQLNSRSCMVFFSLSTLPPSDVRWCYFSCSFSALRPIMLSTSILIFHLFFKK